MAKFLIQRISSSVCYVWTLESTDGKWLARSLLSFDTPQEARSNIAEVKIACTKYTRVEIIENEDIEDILV